MVLCAMRLAGIVVALPQVVEGKIGAFAEPRQSLLRPKFRVAIPGTIGLRPIDCAFRD